MNTTCPQCGKQMNVSPEELAQRDGQVVCPQCLTRYQAVPAGSLPPPSRPVPHASTTSPARHYCPHCGQALGQSINYCPYCGQSLRPEPTTLQPTPPPEAEPTAAEHPSGQPSGHTEAMEWRPLLPTYHLNAHHNHEPASRRFKAVAIATIMALLALLVFIIYHAQKLL